jgi:hypothetical protein
MLQVRRLYKEPHGKARKLVLTEKMLKEYGIIGAERVAVELVCDGQFRVWVPPIEYENVKKAKEAAGLLDKMDEQADSDKDAG